MIINEVKEIEISPRSAGSSAKVHIKIGNKEYILLSCGDSVNVITGHALKHFKASLGICFFSIPAIGSHYKKHGVQLMEYATKVKEMGKQIFS